MAAVSKPVSTIMGTFGPPLDYSFQEIHTLQELAEHVPTSGKHRTKPKESTKKQTTKEPTTNPATLDLHVAGVPDVAEDGPMSVEPDKLHLDLITTSLRLSYNHLAVIDGLDTIAKDMVVALTDITWIDLSHNDIESIGDAFSSFSELKVLYLHANHIVKLNDLLVALIAAVPGLRKLTLFGNPCEERKHYRKAVVHAFPNLISLDFIGVTPRDKDLAAVWARDNKVAGANSKRIGRASS